MSTKKDYRRQKTPRAIKLQELDRKWDAHAKKRKLALDMSDEDYAAWRKEDIDLTNDWWATFKCSDDLSIPF